MRIAQLAAPYTRNDDGTFTRQTDEEAYTFDKVQLHKTFRDAVYRNIPEALATP